MLADLKSASQLLYPGLGLKRWLIPLGLGLVLVGLGSGLVFSQIFLLTIKTPGFWPIATSWQRWVAGVLMMLIGTASSGYSLFRLNTLFLAALLPNQPTVRDVARQIYRHRRQRRDGPKVVVIGGGTGLSVLLRGLKHHTNNITAIITVADDGGSSGKLRRELGVLPPGDFRNCIAALADDEALITQLFQYRFRSGGLEGHSFGNLFITAMAGVTGSFVRALYESGRVLSIGGTILPSTLEDVTLYAEVSAGSQTKKIEGESAIPEARLPIERVYFQPDSPRAFPPAIQAILNADLIVAGPGSLYTSVIPNLLVTEIANAMRASDAPKIYICNVATQPGETDNYTLADHVQAIEAHTDLVNLHSEVVNGADNFYRVQKTKKPLFDYVLANNNQDYPIPDSMSHLKPILPHHPEANDYKVIMADVVDHRHPWRHDSPKLAGQLMRWYQTIKS
jgi:uncharacterized cofD-like protein